VDEIAALPLDRQLTPESLGKAVNWLGKLMRLEKDGLISESDGILSRELEFYCKDGRTIVLDCTFQFIRDEQGKATGILAEGRDITARKRAEEELKQSSGRLRKALGATVQSISIIVEMKDPYTAGHQQRVADLARSIATEMDLSADQRDFIRTTSAIHDIGKISIPSEILSKPTKLTDLEFRLIKTHSQSGYDILKDIDFPWPVADVVLQHHERMDGSGYPQGLKGNDILLEARIMAVADVVEAIASHRPYRPSLGIDFALEEISRNKGILYDADAVDACLKLFQEKSYSLVFKKS
jgi:HD-GYP domain-containing protein (c-di-GMP phosphodiesterase class II)